MPTYSKQLVVRTERREDLAGEPVSRVDLPLKDGSKNVLLVLKVNPKITDYETISNAAKWLSDHCSRMSCQTVTYHGITMVDDDAYRLDVVEVDALENDDDERTLQ